MKIMGFRHEILNIWKTDDNYSKQILTILKFKLNNSENGSIMETSVLINISIEELRALIK